MIGIFSGKSTEIRWPLAKRSVRWISVPNSPNCRSRHATKWERYHAARMSSSRHNPPVLSVSSSLSVVASSLEDSSVTSTNFRCPCGRLGRANHSVRMTRLAAFLGQSCLCHLMRQHPDGNKSLCCLYPSISCDSYEYFWRRDLSMHQPRRDQLGSSSFARKPVVPLTWERERWKERRHARFT